MHKKILEFIDSYKNKHAKTPEEIKAVESVFLNGGCYVFAKILWINFWAIPYDFKGHIIARHGDKFYDITGEVKLNMIIGKGVFPILEEPRIFNLYESFDNFKIKSE